jgi:hypothetical protein
MKLCRFGEMGREKPALVTANGVRRDVSGHVLDFDDDFFATDGVEGLGQWFRANEEKCPVVPECADGGRALRGHRKLCVLD